VSKNKAHLQKSEAFDIYVGCRDDFIDHSLRIGSECDDHPVYCNNGASTSSSYICDGDNDCGDMSDEYCPTASSVSDISFYSGLTDS